jgi:hypothetical protein|tara:strand:- start:464 stop:781 length:318 start_codon:yes stop_codon:yes gene_type:complete
VAINNLKPYSILEDELFKRNLSRDEIALLIGMKRREPSGPLYIEYRRKMSNPYEELTLENIERVALKVGRDWLAICDLCKLGNKRTDKMNEFELKIWALRVYRGL